MLEIIRTSYYFLYYSARRRRIVVNGSLTRRECFASIHSKDDSMDRYTPAIPCFVCVSPTVLTDHQHCWFKRFQYELETQTQISDRMIIKRCCINGESLNWFSVKSRLIHSQESLWLYANATKQKHITVELSRLICVKRAQGGALMIINRVSTENQSIG